MLKLKRVDIQGFKSFYDRSDLRFHGTGIAAIVGPNGCGKSNISDAISWVLGEQSAKSLRGARMEDVIFAGTRDRKPLGLAQVTLTMVDPAAATPIPNAPHHAHIETSVGPDGETHIEAHSELPANANGNGVHPQHPKPEEITITRRLYRSGESDYLINGRPARLRDIQDLFMGTGLGPESYAIIEQGRIGQILSNKPADRRAVIEEAAGIGKYKTRKRLAEAKLESARQNLSRVFDILEEVGRQANSLKRQASKAKRYEELRTQMLGHLRRAVAGRFTVLEREATKLALDLNEAQTAFQGFSAQVQEKEVEHTSTQEACFKTEAALTSARSRVAELNLESERTRGRLEMQAKQIAAIDERLTTGEAETQNLEARHQQENAELQAHTQTLAQLETASATARENLQAKTAERDALQTSLRARERAIEVSRQQVLRLLGEASTLRNQLAQIDEYLAGMERDSARCKREEEAASSDLARMEQMKKDLSTRLSARQMELESLADRRRRVEEEIKQRQASTVAARARLEEVRGALSRQKARKDSLEEILSHRSYTTESVKRLFEHEPVEGFKPAGVLADFVEAIDPAWEKACETFLHEELEYVVVNGWAEAERGIELMYAESDGRATFLVHLLVGQASACPEQSTGQAEACPTGVAGRLSDTLRLTNGLAAAPQDLAPRLSRCFLVSDRATAQQLAITNPDCYFLLPDGVSYHGHAVSAGRKTGGGPLALKRELRELNLQVDQRQRETDALAGEIEELERSTSQLREELEHVRHLQQSQEKDALALDHEQRKLAEEFTRSGSRLSVARLELERLGREDSRARAQREESQRVVAEKEQARFEQEKELEAARAEFERMQAQAHSIGEEHAALRADLAGRDERLRSEKAAAARLEAQLSHLATRRDELARELERMGVERARLLADNIELDRKAASLAEATADAAAEVERLATEETAGRAALLALEECLKALRAEAQTAQDRRSELEVELVKKQGDLKYLDETSRKELNVSASDVAAGESEASDAEEAEQRYQEIRAKIDALGPVNPQALEEYREAQQRYDFLNTQRQDLLDSIRDTEKAIHDLDIESRRRFKEAFDSINEHFREMFRTLFGGGQGEMRLTDEENIGDSGIDIMASPPGKRLQNVALLSGGEKSLTAMALLMAIFRYTPSPFCILDEVDAPLDEPNIQRLTRLIKEMSETTQFIVITHAKRTMEAAQALYGVTMQEPGISKLVSVRFEPVDEKGTQVVELAAV
ncbi:MAG: chromosome segregation protein SMC [Bryobacterales bacterium]|nr:chromosome segregation protein SMC [Bryobacterales bacterium]MBV9398563.1 chromosome segregation protein SMC [Bryobacterales bacterium]